MKKYEKIDMENNMNKKAKELIDSYVWEIEQNGQFNLVKRTDQDPSKQHYDFFDLPDEYMKQVKVGPEDMLFYVRES